eukprot:10380656-Prorocentrum_lima.AAC.1
MFTDHQGSMIFLVCIVGHEDFTHIDMTQLGGSRVAGKPSDVFFIEEVCANHLHRHSPLTQNVLGVEVGYQMRA